jgi:hypothetical protein
MTIAGLESRDLKICCGDHSVFHLTAQAYGEDSGPVDRDANAIDPTQVNIGPGTMRPATVGHR